MQNQAIKNENTSRDEYLLAGARWYTSNWLEVGIGLNIIDLISPLQP